MAVLCGGQRGWGLGEMAGELQDGQGDKEEVIKPRGGMGLLVLVAQFNVKSCFSCLF